VTLWISVPPSAWLEAPLIEGNQQSRETCPAFCLSETLSITAAAWIASAAPRVSIQSVLRYSIKSRFSSLDSFVP
jgi:hypothetical protein